MKRAFHRGLLAGVALFGVLLAGSAALDYSNTSRLHEDAARVAHTREVLDLSSTVLRELVDAETGARGYFITGKDEYLEPYSAALGQLDGRIASLQEETADDPAQQQRVRRLRETVAARLSSLARIVALRREGPDEVQASRFIAEGKAQMDAARELLAQLDQTERTLLAERQQRTSRAYAVAQTSAVLTAVLGLSTMGLLYGLLRRSLRAQEQAADLLEEQREWLRTTLVSIGDAVITTDVEGRVAFLNPVAQTLTGWKEDEAKGRPLVEVFRIQNETTQREIENPALRAVKEGGVVGLANHTVLVSRTGEERPIDDSAAPIRDEHGKVAGAVLVFRDVTDRRRSEEELRTSRDQLRERAEQLADADRRKDEFLAMLAHELRNPLAPIQNAIRLLREIAPTEPQQGRLRDVIDRQVSHMVRLVDDLLDVSRIQRGKIELHKERVRLSKVVESALETSRPLIEACKHQLMIAMEPLVVDGDLLRLAQVVSNLLDNSAKYTPQGGHIRLAVEQAGEQAILRVRDDGIGIPRAMLSRVFDLFTQVDRRVERAQSGLGIGLTVVRRLVEMHGGTVEARSEGEGKGTEMVVRLPLAAVAPEPAASRAGARTASQGAKAPHRRILVVDDNKDGAETLAEMLEMVGHQVRAAFDGPSALETARAFHPDVVLLDIGLPGMSGYDVARELRRIPGLEGALLIAQTGWGLPEHRRLTKEAGFDAHLVKPLRFETVEALLAERRPQGEGGRGGARSEER